MVKFKESPDKYSISYADPGSVLYLVSFPDFGDSLEVLGEPGTTLAEADLFARGRFGGERMAVSVLRAGINSAKREIAGSATGPYIADINPTKTKRSALGIRATGETQIKGAGMTWTATPVDVYSRFDSPGALSVMDSSASKGTGQWQATRALSRVERDAGVKSPRVVIVRNKAGRMVSGAKAPKGSIDLWEFHPTTARLMTSPRIADWKGTASQLLKHYDRIQAKKLGLPEPGLKKAPKKKATKKTPSAKRPKTRGETLTRPKGWRRGTRGGPVGAGAHGRAVARRNPQDGTPQRAYISVQGSDPGEPGTNWYASLQGVVDRPLDKTFAARPHMRSMGEAMRWAERMAVAHGWRLAPKKAPAKKKVTKRARPKGDDEIRLLKRSGKLIATFGVSYKLTQAMEEIRDCARRSKPCKLKTVIRAYDQLRNAAKTAGKTPRQGLAYYVAAELAKDLKRSDELKATTNGDLPRIKEA